MKKLTKILFYFAIVIFSVINTVLDILNEKNIDNLILDIISHCSLLVFGVTGIINNVFFIYKFFAKLANKFASATLRVEIRFPNEDNKLKIEDLKILDREEIESCISETETKVEYVFNFDNNKYFLSAYLYDEEILIECNNQRGQVKVLMKYLNDINKAVEIIKREKNLNEKVYNATLSFDKSNPYIKEIINMKKIDEKWTNEMRICIQNKNIKISNSSIELQKKSFSELKDSLENEIIKLNF